MPKTAQTRFYTTQATWHHTFFTCLHENPYTFQNELVKYAAEEYFIKICRHKIQNI
jgi:hypothetical protein